MDSRYCDTYSFNGWDSKGNEVPHYDYLVLAKFPGGEESLYQYLKKQTKYPPKALNKTIEGTVYISFVIDTIGQIINTEIIKSIHPLLDAEALRVVNNMPLWIPGTEEGKKVKVQYNLPIKFRIAKSGGCLW